MVNTDAYLALGVTIVLMIVGGYTLSLGLRFRQAGKLIDTLRALKDEA